VSTALITRADDLGSSHSANIAIAAAALAGDYIKNVSCMAPGPYIDEGAEMVKSNKNICFGMHAVLNAEWDFIKWQPLSPLNEIPSIVTSEGSFYQDPSAFLGHKPSIEEIMIEFNRQLDYLTNLGINISYIDSHMFPEACIPGLSEAMSGWIREKGLIDHIQYYNFPSQPQPEIVPDGDLEENLISMESWFKTMGDGQFFTVMHPAKYSREMLLCANKKVPVGLVARIRNAEYEMLLSGRLEAVCRKLGIKCLRYDEAVEQGNTFDSMKSLFSYA
jgi:predicted glycoside hydrolase/deacetylase ChbG (UPF0249 family)